MRRWVRIIIELRCELLAALLLPGGSLLILWALYRMRARLLHRVGQPRLGRPQAPLPLAAPSGKGG